MSNKEIIKEQELENAIKKIDNEEGTDEER